MKVCFKTFGCRLNKAEALQMEADYLADGWELTERHSEASLFVVRGCSVTSRAQDECERLIAHLKRHYPTVPVRICGCLKSQTSSTAEVARAQDLARKLQRRHQTDSGIAVPTRTARAYLKVQDGCSGSCAFCIVPRFRGRSSSVDFAEVIDHARRFIDVGYHEIVVTGCNLALYASQGKRLPDLLAALAELTPAGEPSSCRIRLGSVEPGACALETVHAMAEQANVCRFLHIPVQSGSNRILLAMQRPYLVKDVEELVDETSRLMPMIGLGCDLMTGFPGETDLDFTATKTLVKRMPFSNAHVFPYSERPGTPAATLPGKLPHDVRSQRAHLLADAVKTMRTKCATSFVGKTVDVVIEEANRSKGWTGEYFKCVTDGKADRKSIVRVRITKTKGDVLLGTLCKGDEA